MRASVIILNIVLAVALVQPPSAAAQQAAYAGGWESVQSLPTGDEILVKLKDGRSVRGHFTTATDTLLSLTVKKSGSETLNRNDVVQVFLIKRKSEKAKYALIGAGAGAAVGGGLGAAKNSPNIDDGEIYTMVGIPLGAGIGAVVGLLFGQSRQKRVLIYQAR